VLFSTTFQSSICHDRFIRSIAKSPEYLYRRAHPGLPTVRFLAHTKPYANAAGKYDFLDYALRWANPSATAAPAVLTGLDKTSKCAGILSSCLGYAGWWRFNEGAGTVAVDESTNKLNAPFAQTPGWVQGREGTAAVFSTGVYAEVAPSASLRPARNLTMEALASFNGFGNSDPLPDNILMHGIERTMDPECGVGGSTTQAYNLRREDGTANGDKAVAVFFTKSSSCVYSDQGKAVTRGAWTELASTFDGQTARLWQDGTEYTRANSGNLYYGNTPKPLRIGAGFSNTMEPDNFMRGFIDSIRLMGRTLTTDEFLHYPLASSAPGACSVQGQTDTDCDGDPDATDCAPGDPSQGLACGGTACPCLSGFRTSCNAQAHCEYANADPTGWKQWDVWVHVPAGSFTMGSPSSETGHQSSEDPNLTVTFAKGYLIGKYEVTVAEYEACLANGKCTTPSTVDWDGLGWGTNTSSNGRGSHPQNGLTWDQAGAACLWLNGRLPSEAEWEYAASGPVHRKYPWGNSPEPTCSNNTAVFSELSTWERPWGCNACTSAGCSGTSAVGSKTDGASWCGALDMAGNVWEWCQDSWHDNYIGAPTDGSAWMQPNSDYGVAHGGSFGPEASFLRSSTRAYRPLRGGHYSYYGARCLRPLP
jgi:formylglycine-generating enzyme required for sulfatase activity